LINLNGNHIFHLIQTLIDIRFLIKILKRHFRFLAFNKARLLAPAQIHINYPAIPNQNKLGANHFKIYVKSMTAPLGQYL